MEISEEELQDRLRAAWLYGFREAWDDRGSVPLSAVRNNPHGSRGELDEMWVYSATWEAARPR